MLEAVGRFARLNELTEEDLSFVYGLECLEDYGNLVTRQGPPDSFNTFRERLLGEFQGVRFRQFIVSRKSGGRCGTVFLYRYNSQRGEVFLSCYFVADVRRTLVVGEALGLVLNFARQSLGVRSILADVYDYNQEMISFLHRIGGVRGEEEVVEDQNGTGRMKVRYRIEEQKLETISQRVLRLERLG